MFEEGAKSNPSGTPPEEIKKALSLQKRFNCTLRSAYRSVARHWPNEYAWENEIKAKMDQPCVMSFCVPLDQRDYISEIVANFYPPQGSFPFFASKYHMVDSGDLGHHTWGEVKELCNAQQIHWIFIPLPITIICSAANYELLYHYIVKEEGVRNIVGFITTQDDLLPLMDYFSARNAGISAEALAPCIPGATEANTEANINYQRYWPLYLREELQNTWIARYESLPCVEGRQPPHGTLATALSIAPRINLFGNDTATSVSLRKNKASVQQALKAHGLNYIRSVEAWSAQEAVARYDGAIAFPVVVKPACGAGSAFVTLCYTEKEFYDAFRIWEVQRAARPTFTGPMVVEEYIDGDEYVLNTVSFEGRHVVTDMWRSWKYPKRLLSTRLAPGVEQELVQKASCNPDLVPPVMVETFSLLYDRLEFVHNLADQPPEGDLRKVVDYALQCIEVLGMRNGSSHCELRIDRRETSSSFGKPVLIELNPRMQGDVPRSTELVGYDQYTLLVYLSAVAAVFGPASNPSIKRASVEASSPEMASSSKAPCSLPWPPAPQLYRSLVASSNKLSELITRHVVFFCAEKCSVLFDLGVRKVKRLPTFLRQARGNLFSCLKACQTVNIYQTVDLFSSPGACVLQGTEDEIKRDTEIIRRMERATIPCNMYSLGRQIIQSVERAQTMNLQLYLNHKERLLNTNQSWDIPKEAELEAARSDIAASKLDPGSKGQGGEYGDTLCACRRRLRDLYVECERMYEEWRNLVLQMEYPPLFISVEDFHLIQGVKLSWNSLIQYKGGQSDDIHSDCSVLTASERESCLTEVAKRLKYFF